MRYLCALMISLLCCASVFAARPELERDGAGQKMQGCAANGLKDLNLTAASTTVDASADNCWTVYAPTACAYRTMSSATKSGLTRTILSGERVGGFTSSHTPFLNFTGCASGELQRQ